MARTKAYPGIRPTVPSLILLGLFTVLAVVVSIDPPALSEGVRSLMDIVASSRTGGADAFFRVITRLADTSFLLVVVPLVTIAFIAAKRPADGLFIGLSTAFTWGITELFKRIIEVPRPSGWAIIDLPSNMGFPSGHASAGLVFFATFALVIVAILVERDESALPEDADVFTASKAVPLWKGIVALVVQLLALIVVVLIGVSRIYLGVHWVTDVMGGWLLGAAIVAAMSATWSQARRRPKLRE